MISVNSIRTEFLAYFQRNNHEIVPSSPLVPRNDPTLMFTNAGMVPFKNVFTGQETRPYKRAASSQKCVRAGGKHNDLDNVGYTGRHHTFFEMLGNFSFGDYFKDLAIEFAWNLITKEFGLNKERLLVTIYQDDDEAFKVWKKLTGFSDSKIVRIASSDNFWSMGDTGPCGPCSEIFYDHDPDGTKGIKGGPPGSHDSDGDRFTEIWNLVFMQYDQRSSGQRVSLPSPSIDTGMGLERIAAVMEGVYDNYDTDLFKELIKSIQEISHRLGADNLQEKSDGKNRATLSTVSFNKKIAYRVIADHLRSTSFLIADGVLPSNEGRGYVLRRIMRRGMRYAHQLGCKEPLMYLLVPSLVRQMGEAYSELMSAQALITETLKLEETRFKKTLEKGLHLLSEETDNLHEGDTLSGEIAFKLYDTYGFPVDLTEDALKPRGIKVDSSGFLAAMAKQREETRKAWKGSGETATENIWFEIKEKMGSTEFLGYDTETAEGTILTLVSRAQQVSDLQSGDEGALIVNQTPFYGESGGQVGDEGFIKGPNGSLFLVSDTQKKLGDLIVHIGKVQKGSFKIGDNVELDVDKKSRSATRANHSATHLLHEALRQVLGPHVSQRGSLVTPERLRFDFVHQKPMSLEEVKQVEKMANSIILQNTTVETRLMALEEAKASGAMALFGEKYSEEVRVVSMGSIGHGSNKAWSVELCGGTHVKRTGDIGLFKIVSESASSAGVRRIEALTAEGAWNYLEGSDEKLKETATLLKTRPDDVLARVKLLIEERKSLEKQLADTKKQLALVGGGQGDEEKNKVNLIKTVGSFKFFSQTVQGLNPKDLRGLVDDGKKRVGSGIVAIIGITEDGKAGLAVGVTSDLTNTISAVDIAKAGAEAMGGKGGGGRPDMAQAGGPDGSKAQDALRAIETFVQR
ncbi:MAG: alanine--tRNA ligase [Hyphomicrobium sp.]